MKSAFLVSFLIGCAFLALIVGTHVWNSDLFYLEAVFRDLFHVAPFSDFHSIRQFHFSASTFLLPDMLLYFGLRMLTNQLNWVLLLYMSVQFALMMAVFLTWFRGKPKWTIPLAALFFFSVFNQDWAVTFYPVNHSGQWILGTLVLFLLGPLHQRNQKKIWISALVAGFLFGSDILYGIIGWAPYCLLLATNWRQQGDRRRIFRDLVWGLLTVTVAILVYFLFQKITGAHFGWNRPVFGDWNRARNFAGELLQMNVFSTLLVGSVLILILRMKSDLVARYLLISTVICILAVVATGVWSDRTNFRYLCPLPFAVTYAWVCVLLSGLQNLKQHNHHLLLVGTFIVLIIGTFARATQLYRRQAYVSFIAEPYLSENACLDQFVRETHLNEGISDYWAAKYLSFLAHEPVKIVQVDDQLHPFYWVNNHDWYKNFHAQFAIVSFDGNRIATTELPENRIAAPADIRDCGRFKIWVFAKPL